MELTQDMDLRESRGLQGAIGTFKAGNFLSLDEVYDLLESTENLNPTAKKMKNYLQRVKSDKFFEMRISFLITRVRHVTTEEGMRRILQTKFFMGNKLKLEPLKDFSYWSAEIGDVNHQEAFETVKHMVTEKATAFEKEIKGQFATSPAFNNSESRYGNFVFSFPLSDLLEAYKAQHCDGGEPQLRVLGTEMYKVEISHIVMVHSPHIEKYNDLPLVPTLPNNSQPTLSVYREEDGTLCWRPESTSKELHVRISSTGDITEECALDNECYRYRQSGSCDHKKFCVGNQLMIAFHLPGDQRLKIPEEHLLQNLSTCEASTIYLRDTILSKDTADKILEKVKNG